MNSGEHENPETQPPSYGAPPPPLDLPKRIQWNVLFRLASPLAVASGVVSALLPPVGLLLVLPLSLKRIIARYRTFHSEVLRAGQGALMGAFTALLSFAAFLVFFLPLLSLRRADLVAQFADMAAHTPDPQQKQFDLWLTTNEGFVTIALLGIASVLAAFLIVGAVSGAFITRPRKTTLRP